MELFYLCYHTLEDLGVLGVPYHQTFLLDLGNLSLIYLVVPLVQVTRVHQLRLLCQYPHLLLYHL